MTGPAMRPRIAQTYSPPLLVMALRVTVPSCPPATNAGTSYVRVSLNEATKIDGGVMWIPLEYLPLIGIVIAASMCIAALWYARSSNSGNMFMRAGWTGDNGQLPSSGVLDPDAVSALTDAYENACAALGLVGHSDLRTRDHREDDHPACEAR